MKIVLLGAPGSGKGTISNILCSQYNLLHISTGDLFREALAKDDDFSKQIKEFVLSGSYVPDWITNKIAHDAIVKSEKKYNGFILDGYPRTINQADFLKDHYEIDHAILLDVDHDTLFKRISGRRICQNCKTIYNVYFYNKPKHEDYCDKCGHSIVQRKDDTPEVVESRIKIYFEQTKPLIEYYKNMGILNKIDATQTIDEILTEIENILK